MSPSRARFVTVCQQLLALGVVVVALVPATRVVSLDVVGVQPGSAERPSVRIEPTLERTQRPAPSVRVAERRSAQGSAQRSTQRSAQRAARHALRLGDGLEAGRAGP